MRLCAPALIALAALAGCQKAAPSENAPHPRLVVFSPALTKMVFDMRLGDHVVGVDRHALLPPGVRRPIVGDVLNVRVEPILAVKPDAILCQVDSRGFDALRRVRPDLPIEHFTLETLDNIAAAMERVGRLAGRADLGLAARREFERKLTRVRERTAGLPRKDVLFVVDFERPLAAGRDTFIDEIITIAGGRNIMAESFRGWRKPTAEDILRRRPELVLCQCLTVRDDAAEEYWRGLLAKGSGKSAQVVVVTDRMWTIGAAHLADYAEKLAAMLHPQNPVTNETIGVLSTSRERQRAVFLPFPGGRGS